MATTELEASPRRCARKLSLRLDIGGCIAVVLFITTLAGARHTGTEEQQSTVKVELSKTPFKNALCLDGSPPVYYVSKGHRAKKWMVWLEGGDWCERIPEVQSEEESAAWSCSRRARKRLGSSKHERRAKPRKGGYPVDLDSFGKHRSQFSRVPSENSMHDWMHVMVRYCDGGSFSGTSKHVMEADGLSKEPRVLHMQGRMVLKAVMHDLLVNQGMANARDVVIAGSSAGGLGVMIQSDDLHSLVTEAASAAGQDHNPRVALLVDDGIFAPHQALDIACRYHERMEAVYRLHKPKSTVLQRCRDANPNDPSRCMFGTALIPHIQTPTFFTVSAFDIWQIKRILCMPDNSHEIDRYGTALRDEVKAAVRASGVPHGLFVDSCPHHTYCMDTIKVNGTSATRAFEEWLNAGRKRRSFELIDESHYGNPKCDAFYNETSCPFELVSGKAHH